jgi:hypothetical protein
MPLVARTLGQSFRYQVISGSPDSNPHPGRPGGIVLSNTFTYQAFASNPVRR